MKAIIGVLCSCLGNSCVAASYSLQKYAHLVASTSSKSVYQMPIFWIGLFLMAPGEMGNFFALGMIPASIVAPLGSLTILLNALSARKFLRETLQKKGYYGAAIVMGGASLVISSTPAEIPPTGLTELENRLKNNAFCIYAVLLVVGSIICNLKKSQLLPNVFIMGAVGCFCALSTKTVSFMLQTGDNRWLHPLTLCTLAVLITSIVSQIMMFQRVLASFPVSQVVPLHFVTYTLMTSIGATLLYGELTNTPATKVLMFMLGSSLCFVGSYLVSTGRSYEQQPQQEHDHGYELVQQTQSSGP